MKNGSDNAFPKQTMSIGTLSIASGWSGGNSWLIKSGNIVECYVEITGGTLSSGWNTVATLPSGFRPYSYFDSIQDDNGRDSFCTVKVTSGDGYIQVYKTSTTSNNLRLHFSFIAYR